MPRGLKSFSVVFGSDNFHHCFGGFFATIVKPTTNDCRHAGRKKLSMITH